MKICNLLGMLGMLICFGTVTLSVAAYASTLSAQGFVRKAAIASQFEIESSKLALQKSQNRDIQDFAQRMIDDHTKTSEKLKQVLASTDEEIKLPRGLDNKHQKLLNDLQTSSDSRFDRLYIAIQTDAHREAVTLFTDYSKLGKDAPLKRFARQTLPTLKEHLSHVRQLKSRTRHR